jgi:hypothetical protein
MNFPAYLEVRELNSESTPVSCIPGGNSAAEVILGARDVPLDWAGVPSREEGGRPLVLNAEARWTFQGPQATVRGIGGSLTIQGKAGFKGADLNYIGASLAIGETENYFAGKGSADVKVPIFPPPATIKAKFRAGIFAGYACTIEPLKFVDKEVEKVLLNTGDFRGVYLEFGGSLSLADPLELDTPDGVPGCLLEIKAAITTALYYERGPRYGIIGARQKIGADIELLCLARVHADWELFAALDTADQLVFGGSANACVKVGICPLCAHTCGKVTIKGVFKDGGIDYFVDTDNPAFED